MGQLQSFVLKLLLMEGPPLNVLREVCGSVLAAEVLVSEYCFALMWLVALAVFGCRCQSLIGVVAVCLALVVTGLALRSGLAEGAVIVGGFRWQCLSLIVVIVVVAGCLWLVIEVGPCLWLVRL